MPVPIVDIFTAQPSYPINGTLLGSKLDPNAVAPTHTLVALGDVRRISEKTQAQQDAEIAKRVEALAPVANQAARLALPFGTGTDQVQRGDEVLQADNSTWYKFTGNSAADLADNTKWQALGKTGSDGGRYVGDAATFATLPTTFNSAPVVTGDKAYLTADVIGTGTAAAPQYPQGWYGYNGTVWTQHRKEVPVDALDCVYPADNAASVVSKVNCYTNAAAIGAAPAVVAGKAYSTFALDTGELNSFVPNKAGTAWVPIASAGTDPGVYAGFAATFAALPAKRRDATVLVTGDWAQLTATDGTNQPGVYRWNGTAWVFDFGSAANEVWQTVTVTSAKQSAFTVTALRTASPLVTLNGQEIEVTVNAARTQITIADSDVIAIVETSDVLRVRG